MTPLNANHLPKELGRWATAFLKGPTVPVCLSYMHHDWLILLYHSQPASSLVALLPNSTCYSDLERGDWPTDHPGSSKATGFSVVIRGHCGILSDQEKGVRAWGCCESVGSRLVLECRQSQKTGSDGELWSSYKKWIPFG